MGSYSQSKLHVVEFTETNTTPGSSSWRSTSDLVRHALETHGCVVVICRKARALPLDDMWRTLKELFDLPLETKAKNKNEFLGSYGGYEGNYTKMPLFQSFGIGDGATRQVAEEFTTLMWPHGYDDFCESIHSYSNLLRELDRTVKKMVASSYGVEKYYDNLVDSSAYNTRIIKYRAPVGNEGDLGLQAHRDKSFLTVVGTNQVRGLEIETPDGEWVDFEPSPDRFVVVAGEPLMAWSNGRIYSPLHKVVSRSGSEDKYSVGLFSYIQGTLQIPEELVDDDNPLKFKAFDNMEFLDYCKKQGQPSIPGAIKAYCGI